LKEGQLQNRIADCTQENTKNYS